MDFQSEIDRAMDILYTMRSIRCVTKLGRHIVLNAPYIVKGRSHDVKVKNLPCGVKELKLVKMDLGEKHDSKKQDSHS